MSHWRGGKLPPESLPDLEARHDNGLRLVACRPALVKKEPGVTMRRSDVYRGNEVTASTWIVRAPGEAERTFSDEASAERFFAEEFVRSGG
jgi:hypothetical protein